MYRLFFYLIISFIFTFCSYSSKKNPEASSYKNIQWKLIGFEDTARAFKKGDWLWIDAEFLNEKDSVFWNSHHEGADKFFIQLKDTIQHPFFYPLYFSSEQDSLLIIAPKTQILQSIFHLTKCPVFLEKDSILKCYLKIRKKIFSSDQNTLSILKNNEWQVIQAFLEKNHIVHQIDKNNIVWIEPLPIPDDKNRTFIREATVAYTGYFLDGRIMDHSDSLGIRYNDTLQLIEGLNYVIKKLEVGQSAKIILPSQLAFGERGSFNKTVPPFTPLLYEIKLLQIQ